MKKSLAGFAALLAVASAANAQNVTFTGPSTGSTPYAVPTNPFVRTYSVATVDNTGSNPDDVFPKFGGGNYSMAGIPDGLGAFSNGNGTFTVLMNHEIGNTAGVTRDHGSVGAFVSKWIINKDTLAVTGAGDLIQSVVTWDTANGTYNSPGTTAFGRLCSGDLPAVSALYNSNTSLGTQERIFFSGEEIGAGGRAFAHIVTGSSAGVSYELPRLGKFSWENSIANPVAQDKTIVVGTDDSTTNGQVYVYVGTKTSSGTDIDKAGLTNGLLYGIKVGGNGTAQQELRTTSGNQTASFGLTKNGTTSFSLVAGPNGGNVTSTTGAALDAHSSSNGVSNFLRPEDAAWDPTNGARFYFVTTDRYDTVKDGGGQAQLTPPTLTGNGTSQVGRSRLWSLTFDDIANPENGGTIKLVLDGTEAGNMFDNISVDATGKVQLVEDVGNQYHNGKLWEFNPADGTLTMLAQHDVNRFGNIANGVATSATGPFNADEEFSGIIDITDLMAGSALSSGHAGERWFLMDDQAHYTTDITSAQVEGGQLIVVQVIPEPSTYALLALGAGAMAFGIRRRKA